LFLHRKTLPGRPTENCAADNRHFLKSSLLAYHFLLITHIEEDQDGQLVNTTLKCTLCHQAGTNLGEWHAVKKGGSIGNFMKHFRERHSTWWVQISKEGKANCTASLVDNEEVNGF
jgi:hypothetical protein